MPGIPYLRRVRRVIFTSVQNTLSRTLHKRHFALYTPHPDLLIHRQWQDGGTAFILAEQVQNPGQNRTTRPASTLLCKEASHLRGGKVCLDSNCASSRNP